MSTIDNAYATLLSTIIGFGNHRPDRTGTGTKSIFGYQYSVDAGPDEFPLLTCKKVPFKLVVAELDWFLSGRTDLRFLLERDVHFWTPDAVRHYSKMTGKSLTIDEFEQAVMENDDFAETYGDISNAYGHQWRNFFGSTDQITNLLDGLVNDPYSRRHIVSAWNPYETEMMTLPPCHMMFQLYVGKDNRLDMKMYQRSADVFLGVPLNIACYALLLNGIANAVGMTAGTFTHTFGDLHLYNNHFHQAEEVIGRVSNFGCQSGPSIEALEPSGWYDQNVPLEPGRLTNFKLINYNPMPAIRAELSVGTV